MDKTEVLKGFRSNIVKSGDIFKCRSKFDFKRKEDEWYSIDLVCHTLRISLIKMAIHIRGIELNGKIPYELEVHLQLGKRITPVVEGYIGRSKISTEIISVDQFKDLLSNFMK